MGTYLLIVNPARREYLDPMRFGESNKPSAALQGPFCARALSLLIADDSRRDATSFRGAWLGDPIILAGDDTGLPNPGGVATASSDNPARNLHAVATEEFADISYRALAELCLDIDTAGGLAARSTEDDLLLLNLGAMLGQYRAPALEPALGSAVGRPWRRAWNQARARRPWWSPPPPIDWPPGDRLPGDPGLITPPSNGKAR